MGENVRSDEASEDSGGPERILVVDDDPDIARFIEVNLRAHGFDVMLAADGVEALEIARTSPPNLALVDVMMPRMDGFELVERLRGGVRTANVPVIILTARALTADKVVGLTAGADDYIIKPFDPIELVARVRGTLKRAQEMRAASPLTGLPGNVQIREHLARLIARSDPFALLYADLDNFKAYNDHYGFLRGDAAIRAMSHCIQEASRDVAGDDVFVGHVGGDDFVVVCRSDQAEAICSAIVERCERETPKLYDDADRDRGYVEVESRRGELERFPLLSISVGVARSDIRSFGHPGEAVTVASELKEFAKRRQGSTWEMDRRTT